MTLLIALLAAIISTLLWYCNENRDKWKLGTLALMYWGASLMWLVDAIFEYAALQAAYFTPAVKDMINDTFLGVSVVAFGLLIWLFMVLIKDPKGVLCKKITNQ